MKYFRFRLIIFLLGIAFLFPTISAAHYIAGTINNALDGTSANGYKVVLWNPANGINDNLTDIIGTTGNSGADKVYMVDCELLKTPCLVGDEIRVKFLENGSGYVTLENFVNLSVTGFGFDIMPNLTLNSPPNVTLNSPVNYYNTSSNQINFNCSTNDLDGNLKDMTLYGNWSGWHANETKNITGTTNSTTFTKTLTEGIYNWNCLASDNLSISKFAGQNSTFTLDLSPPVISSVKLNVSGDICGIQKNVKVNCTASDSLSGIQKIIIQAIKPSGITNYTAQFLSGNSYFSDILLNETGTWKFNCIAEDNVNNTAQLNSNNLSVHSNSSDLTISSNDITFSNLDPIENSPVIINATVHNNGCSDANNFLVGFFEGNPDSSGLQINGNQTVSVPSLGNSTTNITWNAKIGFTNIFVSLDLNNSITESNKTNNKANKTISVNAWQRFYGNVTIDKLLADQNNKNMSLWLNQSSLSGNIFVTDTESNIAWDSLQAIGKNISGGNTTNDFTDIDTLLNMTNFIDSVSNVFTSNGNTPIKTSNFFIYQKNISQVPVINSTNNSNFITGILWDTSDDSDGQYDISDKEDLVFVTKINKKTQGTYGLSDYEIRIPVKLREYYTADTKNVFIYFDLN